MKADPHHSQWPQASLPLWLNWFTDKKNQSCDSEPSCERSTERLKTLKWHQTGTQTRTFCCDVLWLWRFRNDFRSSSDSVPTPKLLPQRWTFTWLHCRGLRAFLFELCGCFWQVWPHHCWVSTEEGRGGQILGTKQIISTSKVTIEIQARWTISSDAACCRAFWVSLPFLPDHPPTRLSCALSCLPSWEICAA